MAQPQVDWGAAKPIGSAQVDWGSATPIGGPPAPPEQPGFFENLGHAFGVEPGAADKAYADFSKNPLHNMASAAGGAVNGLVEGGKRIGGELQKAFQSGTQGDTAGMGVHAVQAIPFAGPAMEKMADESPTPQPGQSWWDQVKADATPGNIGTATGAAAQLAPAVLGGADMAMPGRDLVGEIPTRARAGKLFDTVAKDAANQPVNLTRTQPQLQKMLTLGKEGGGAVPGPVRQLANTGGLGTPKSVPLLRAMQNELNGIPAEGPAPQPLLYPSARNFQSGLASLSRDDAGGMAGPMRGNLKQVNKALYGDVKDAASAVGRGNQYARAMRMNRQANQLANVFDTAKKWAVPAAVGAVGGGLAAGAIRKAMQ